MSKLPETHDEWTIHVLNIHGTFFERKVAAILRATEKWSVISTNYPVEYPPPNGPFRGKESCLDIWASKTTSDGLIVDALVECKKANPEFVNWVFFKEVGADRDTSLYRINAIKNKVSENGDSRETMPLINNGWARFPVVDDAREVRGNYLDAALKKDSKTKTLNSSIQDASYQIALALRGVFHEESSLLNSAKKSSAIQNMPWAQKLYVPIIATTAKLHVVEFSDELIDQTTGEIDLLSPKLREVEAVMYKYPLPKHLQLGPKNSLDRLNGLGNEVFNRMDIMVIHVDSFAELLSSLFEKDEQ